MLFDAGKSLFVFYMMVSANFLGSLFGCRIQDILTNNMLIKHFLGLLTIYFFIRLTAPAPDPENVPTPFEQLYKSAFIYVIFIISTKMNYKYWTPFIILLGMLYMLSIYRDYNNQVKKPEKYILQPSTIDTLEQMIYVITIITLILGFLHYLGEKKLEYKSTFNYWDFMIGKPSCKRYTPSSISSVPFSKMISIALTQ